ncbi:MAG: hypothetical protein WC279_14400 [Sulfurimonas sp.]|jgi:hypothetical protein|uniref:hypothetical protein n=1 Tax=Sulfurimonas sp. TaxID=2022749 RepID=UPI0035631CBE
MIQVKLTDNDSIEITELEPFVNKEKKKKQFVIKGTDNWALAGEGDTWLQAKEHLNFNLRKLEEMGITWEQAVRKQLDKVERKHKYLEWKTEFKKITGITWELKFDRFMYMLTGLLYLDVFEMSKYLGIDTNPDKSLEDWVRERGGERAVELCKLMIGD